MITQNPMPKKRKQQKINLELKKKIPESNLNSEDNRKLCYHCKNGLETIYDYIADDIKIRVNVNSMSMVISI